MTTNDKLRRLRESVTISFNAKSLDLPMHEQAFAAYRSFVAEIDRLLAEPEAQAPSEAAPPVTDAEVEEAIEMHADDWHHAGVVLGKSGIAQKEHLEAKFSQERLRALIARRVQQAGAAAEELARAVDAYVSLPAEHFQIRGTLFRDLCTALAAFRAAQGGAS